MIGVDDRLVTPATMKWVKIGLTAGLATIPTTIILYYILGMAVDSALEGSNMLRQWIAICVGLVLLKAGLAWIFRTGQFRASSAAKLNVRDQIYKQVVKLGPGILDKRRTGEIANTATEGVEYLDYYFGVYFVQIWVAIAIPIFLCIAIFSIDWVVGLWMLAGVPLTPMFVGFAAQGFRRISGSNEEIKNKNFAQYLDSIQGMATLKMFNQDRRRGKQMEDGNEAQRKVTMRLLLVAQFQFVFMELGFALFSTAFAMAVSLYRYSGGFMSPGEAVAVVLMSLEFSRTLLMIGEFFFAGALGREVAAEVVKFLDEEPPVKSSEGNYPGPTGGRAISIEFKDVTFTYPGAEAPAIKQLNMSLQPNESVALVGKSGSGKTTVTNLILRTLDTDSGHLLYDGHQDDELSLEWIREQIALATMK
jgi:ABC-type transport system involved in cytochrome bd biosynthesis fused ATPase/permease subunit